MQTTLFILFHNRFHKKKFVCDILAKKWFVFDHGEKSYVLLLGGKKKFCWVEPPPPPPGIKWFAPNALLTS